MRWLLSLVQAAVTFVILQVGIVPCPGRDGNKCRLIMKELEPAAIIIQTHSRVQQVSADLSLLESLVFCYLRRIQSDFILNVNHFLDWKELNYNLKLKCPELGAHTVSGEAWGRPLFLVRLCGLFNAIKHRRQQVLCWSRVTFLPLHPLLYFNIKAGTSDALQLECCRVFARWIRGSRLLFFYSNNCSVGHLTDTMFICPGRLVKVCFLAWILLHWLHTYILDSVPKLKYDTYIRKGLGKAWSWLCRLRVTQHSRGAASSSTCMCVVTKDATRIYSMNQKQRG